ncbi:hypothetical protein PIB30_095956 [Stylosanthes scabra]|uniref:Uncharacterized protein n=1 Tax=Stylosanthes scabra TaxID=79078 RepID=A0ABU6QXA1_9FABA|nr:hypothetical protein [Stylosanthes scabra]
MNLYPSWRTNPNPNPLSQRFQPRAGFRCESMTEQGATFTADADDLAIRNRLRVSKPISPQLVELVSVRRSKKVHYAIDAKNLKVLCWWESDPKWLISGISRRSPPVLKITIEVVATTTAGFNIGKSLNALLLEVFVVHEGSDSAFDD